MGRWIVEKMKGIPLWRWLLVFFLCVQNNPLSVAVDPATSFWELLLTQLIGYYWMIAHIMILLVLLPIYDIFSPSSNPNKRERAWLEQGKVCKWVCGYVLYAFVVCAVTMAIFIATNLFIYLLKAGYHANFSNAPFTQFENSPFTPSGTLYEAYVVNLICNICYWVFLCMVIAYVNLRTKRPLGAMVVMVWTLFLGIPSHWDPYLYWDVLNPPMRVFNSLFHNWISIPIWLILIGGMALLLFAYVKKRPVQEIYAPLLPLRDAKPRVFRSCWFWAAVVLVSAGTIFNLIVIKDTTMLPGEEGAMGGINWFVHSMMYMMAVLLWMPSVFVMMACMPQLRKASDRSLSPKRQWLQFLQTGVTGGGLCAIAHLLSIIVFSMYSGRLLANTDTYLQIFRDVTVYSWAEAAIYIMLNSIAYGFLFGLLAHAVARFLPGPELLFILLPMFEIVGWFMIYALYILFGNSRLGLIFPQRMFVTCTGQCVWVRWLNIGFVFVLAVALMAISLYLKRKKRNHVKEDTSEHTA